MNLYEQYALLKSKMTELENKEAELRTQILEDMIEKNVKEPVKIGMGSFTKSMRKIWTYTDKVKNLEEDWKAEKIKEQNNDIATFVEKPSFTFTPAKIIKL
jgi:hypothetical protein